MWYFVSAKLKIIIKKIWIPFLYKVDNSLNSLIQHRLYRFKLLGITFDTDLDKKMALIIGTVEV